MTNAPCPECGSPVTSGKAGKLFCSTGCHQAFKNRNAKRGKTLTPLVLAWRRKRGSGDVAKAAFQELCSVADRFNAEDREAGRLPMNEYMERTKRTHHTRLLDR